MGICCTVAVFSGTLMALYHLTSPAVLTSTLQISSSSQKLLTVHVPAGKVLVHSPFNTRPQLLVNSLPLNVRLSPSLSSVLLKLNLKYSSSTLLLHHIYPSVCAFEEG